MSGNIFLFQDAGLVFKVYTYPYCSNRYYMRESFRDEPFRHVSASYLREHFPCAFSLIKEEVGTRKYMGV